MNANKELPSYQARQRMIARLLKLDAKGENWVTFKNGTHVCLDNNGIISKGPDNLVGKHIKELFGKDYIPEAGAFAEPDTVRHRQHAKDFGCSNQKEYAQRAIDFFNSGDGDMYYTEERDNIESGCRYYLYNERKKVLCICDIYGQVRTMFIASKKKFEKIKKQDKLK